MANFAVLADPEEARSDAWLRKVRSLTPAEGLTTSDVRAGTFTTVWAAASAAPVSSWADADGSAVIWGEAIGNGGRRLAAQELARGWDPGSTGVPDAFDGFYAAAVCRSGVGLVVGGDLLGLFPVYYADRGEVTIVASSPHLIAQHPLFGVEIDVAGLVDMLLTQGPVLGATPLKGVRRLRARHALVWLVGQRCREVRQYEIPEASGGGGTTFAQDVERLDSALRDAVRRQVEAGVPCGLLLSGGRDSRMFGGYLRAQRTVMQALTFGRPADYDLRCAIRVARRLRCDHRVASIEAEEFAAAAERQARWEQVCTGFSTVHMWAAIDYLRDLPDRCLTGYVADAVVSGRAPGGVGLSFDEFFAKLTRRGLTVPQLRQLLRTDVVRGVLDETVEHIREVFQGSADAPGERAWRFQLSHTERVHAGAVPWRLAFGSWPVLPILDRGVLEAIGPMAATSLAERRAQDEILRSRFPDLARLPLDRNDYDIEPLAPSFLHRVTGMMLRRLRVDRGLHRLAARRGLERRYFYRMYDFNGPGWRAIRELAEPHRERLAGLFDLDALAEILPGPHVRVEMEDAILDGFGRKQLVGLMLWARDHLS